MVCGSRYPDDGRYADIPGGERPSTWAHEIGHMLHWPHTFTDALPIDDYNREYDYPLDLMSGNQGVWEEGGYTLYGSHPEPFDTAAINRYAAGWIRDIDPVWDPSAFFDTGGHVFEGDIEWLAESGITRGCNPPDNTRFCPDDAVTRGQMAAFLHRALGN